ncbi:hypothetical protein EZV62_023996 [Acer yangbiense]|uniref:Uncharacterized protein n=1 Tax=Acer yangbiense TaxID=1000413 RepID=A0A5C7H4V9_9ROSI|nr:hypothetical protein EZV62_023996 [Acer yangbiense]
MSLTEREGPVHTLKIDLKDVGLKRMSSSLVGKNAEDKQKIIAGGPWSFDEALIAMEEPEGKGDIQRMKFNKAEFWIKNHNALLMCMFADIGRFLGGIVGDVVDIDDGDSGSQVASFLRVQVAIEIDKPLHYFLRINVLGDGVETVMLLKYEWLLDFCFRFGLLGHGVRDCPDKPREAAVLKGEELLFGFWLRASTLARKTGNWGRKGGMRERGDRGNWRPLERLEVDKGGGRSLAPGVEHTGSNQLNPILEISKKGKEIVNQFDRERKAEIVAINGESTLPYNQGVEEKRNFGVNVESNFPKKQGMEGEMNFVFNSTQEKKGVSEGIKVARDFVFVDMGHRRGTCPSTIEGILDGNGHNGELDRLKPQRMNLIQVGDPNPSPLSIADQGIATDKITPQAFFNAQNSQIVLQEQGLENKWKRRARNQQRSYNNRVDGAYLGKKKKIDDHREESNVNKK